MQKLREVHAVRQDGQGVAWFQHVVRPLLRTPGQVRAALADSAGCDALRHHAPPRPAHAFGRAAGVEGAGCRLSAEELSIATRVRSEPLSWEGGQ